MIALKECPFLGDTWFLLQTSEGGQVVERHTAAVIEEKIRRSLSRLEIDMSKVSFFVADGATVTKSTAMNLNLK
ncbi:unnamed protein product [Nippostrongylus brasiliensis]|uniref:DUF1902 domain-containing protein n=1 Tax=Nippostrongylus brasiliensis TaxID=27835 RepID=A0A0N4Y9I6_NIPBR|nr:unnamed protein product [Nippostrongylus brasiliensis]